MLFNEPKLLKFSANARNPECTDVSVLFNEPKLLKSHLVHSHAPVLSGFSALQRAEIAEIVAQHLAALRAERVSVLFNEPKLLKFQLCVVIPLETEAFQCSSTSRNC